MWLIVLVIIITFFVYTKAKTNAPKDKKTNDIKIKEISSETKNAIDYSQAYQARYLLSKNEWHEYKKLKEYAEAKNLQVCPKIRLLDLIEPRRGDGYMSRLGKIQSKHVDFVITDQDLRVKAIIELDDSSHETPERAERDIFVDEVLSSVGYIVIHIRSITPDILDFLE